MAQNRLASAKAARATATDSLLGGVQGLIGTAGSAAEAGDDSSGNQGIGDKLLKGLGF